MGLTGQWRHSRCSGDRRAERNCRAVSPAMADDIRRLCGGRRYCIAVLPVRCRDAVPDPHRSGQQNVSLAGGCPDAEWHTARQPGVLLLVGVRDNPGLCDFYFRADRLARARRMAHGMAQLVQTVSPRLAAMGDSGDDGRTHCRAIAGQALAFRCGVSKTSGGRPSHSDQRHPAGVPANARIDRLSGCAPRGKQSLVCASRCAGLGGVALYRGTRRDRPAGHLVSMGHRGVAQRICVGRSCRAALRADLAPTVVLCAACGSSFT